VIVDGLFSTAASGFLAGMVFGPRRPRFWLGATLVGAAALLGAAMAVLLGVAPEWDRVGTFALGGEHPHLRLDALSAVFLALLAVVGGAGAAYSRDYWSDHHYPRSAGRSRFWWSVLVAMMALVLVSANGLYFLFAWELFTVAAFFLILLESRGRKVRAAAWLYLAASHVGTLCLFAFFALLAERTGSWDLGPQLREVAGLAPLFWLALVGFGVKAGLFPLHVWLPSAHANAPSHVSAILSGVAIKLGVYGIVRFSGWLPLPTQAGWIVIALGAVGALFGIAFAFAQNDLKRLLAYCSVENVGVILIGVGAAMLGTSHGNTPWGRLALIGALLHVWNHGLFKSLLFFGAGSVLHATGTRDISRLGGLWTRMPWTAGLFAVGSIAVSSLPPLNGFVSEWLIYLGLFDSGIEHGPMAWATIPVTIVLGMAGALALASFAKAGALVFCGAPRTKRVAHAHEAGPWMLGPMLIFGVMCVALGLGPAALWPLIGRAAGVWNPAWQVSAESAPASLSALGHAHVVLALVVLGAAVLLWRRARANGLRRGLTWDCGYAAPKARMQYTSGSFSGIAAGWFFWLLQPERVLQRPRGPMPEFSRRVERVPETVLEKLIGPVGEGVLRVSTAVRRLQHGRLQYYILYLVAGLAALGLIVLLEGSL
jgi:hydrogenase-4 component B